MVKHSLPSIEQIAAFLDGNLSENEMKQFSQLAENNDVLHQLLDANSVVENTLAGFTDSDLQLPPEIVGSDFELPTIPAEGISPLVTLSPEPMDDMLVAAATCADEDLSLLSDVNSEEHSTIGGELHDDSSHMIPGDDGFSSNDDLSGSLLDDM
jgi:hypothetical protein